MSVLDKKLGREIWQKKGLLLAITLIISLGISIFVGMESTFKNLKISQEKYYAQCRMAHFSVEIKKAPNHVLRSLINLRGISSLRFRLAFSVIAEVEGVSTVINGRALSMPPERTPVINDLILVQGEYFTGKALNEVIINDSFARANHLKPGDAIQVILNHRKQKLRIVGTALSSEYVYITGQGSFLPNDQKNGIFWLRRDFMEEVFDFQDASNQIIGTTSWEKPRERDALLEKMERKLEPFGVFSTTPRRDQPSHRFLTDEMSQLQTMADIFPLIFLAVAAFVLNVLMRRLLEQQRLTIGTLKALGYRDREIFFHYLHFGLVVGLAGGFLGGLLGILYSTGMIHMYKQYFKFPHMYNQIHPLYLLIGLVISLFFALLGTFRGLYMIQKLEPAEAMRPAPPPQGGKTILDGLTWIWRRLTFGGKMAFRAVFRNRFRSAVTMSATAASTALLICGMSITASSSYFIDFQFRQLVHHNYEVTFKDFQGYEAFQEVLRLPGVDYGEPILHLAGTFRHGPFKKQISIAGLLPGGRLKTPLDIDGNPIAIPRRGLVITEKLSRHLEVEIGDVLEFTPSQGRREKRLFVVKKIVRELVGMSAYASLPYLSRITGEELALSGVLMEVDPTAMETIRHQVKNIPAIAGTSEPQTELETIEKLFLESINITNFIFILFAGVISFGTIFNHSLISLSEREREMATLRVLGHSSWQVGAIFLRENLILNLSGALVGLPAGWLFTRAVVAQFSTEFFTFPYVFHLPAFLIAPLLALLFSLITHIFVQRQIHKLDWLKALKIKE